MNLLTINHLQYHYDDQVVIDDFSYEFTNGIYCLFAPNHSGKSTLFNCIVDNFTTTNPAIDSNIKSFSYLPQEGNLLPWLSVKENLELFKQHSANSLDYETFVTHFHLEPHLNKFPHELSGGTYKKFNLIALICFNAQLLLLDEPFVGVDLIDKLDLIELIKQTSDDKIIIYTTHDRDCINNLATSIIACNPPLHVKAQLTPPIAINDLLTVIK